MNVDVTINSGLNVEAVFSSNDIAVSVAFADPLKVDVEILAGTKGIKGDSMFQQVGTEIIPIDENATLDASFIANLPEIDNEVTETGTNPVEGKGIFEFVKGLFTTHTTEANAHPASAISHRNSNVADRIDGITEGDVTRDVDGNLTSITTFGEATGFIRDIEGNVIGWEDDTHIRMIKYTAAGDFDGWTLTEKP
jgi:hypothetical protein